MKSRRFILTLILAAVAYTSLMAQPNPAAKLVGHWLNRSLLEIDGNDQETHVLIHREADGKVVLNLFTITHAKKTSLLEVKHGRWELAGDTYTETFPASEESDDYAVIAITDTDFRYSYQEGDETTVELLDEKIDARRFAPPPLPSGYKEMGYELWGQPAPTLASMPPKKQTPKEPEQTRQQLLSTAVMNNLRQLAAAAEQYFLEAGTRTATLSDLVGPDKYIRILPSHDGEDYSKLIINDRWGKWTVTTASGLVVSYER